MSNKIAFIICTEPGRLEGQSLLLAESIRKFCGELKNTPIYSFHPRRGEPISKETSQAFRDLDVIHQQVPINTKFHDYYLANKPLVCAYAEQSINAEILVFLDSDKCFFAEPKEFLLPADCNVRMRVEYGKGIGSNGTNDPQDEYWQKLYKVLGVKREIFVNTSIGNKRIRGYWNSGLIAVRRSAGIFRLWKDNFEKVMELNIVPPQSNYFVEQSVLSATLTSLEEDISSFSPSYSYPLRLHNQLSSNLRIDSLENIVSVHYFNFFYYQDWDVQLKKLKNFDKEVEKYRWLYEGVKRHKMPFRKKIHRHLQTVKKVELKLNSFNLNIKISHLIERLANI